MSCGAKSTDRRGRPTENVHDVTQLSHTHRIHYNKQQHDHTVSRVANVYNMTTSTPVVICRSATGLSKLCHYTRLHTFNGPLSRTTRVSRYQKEKQIWILLKQETVSGSGIRWAICKSASRSRQRTTPAPHHSVFLQAGCPSCRPTNSVKALKALCKK